MLPIKTRLSLPLYSLASIIIVQDISNSHSTKSFLMVTYDQVQLKGSEQIISADAGIHPYSPVTRYPCPDIHRKVNVGLQEDE